MEIPLQVHRLWLGGPEPEWTRPFADTWRRPGWELVEWDDESVQELFPLRNQAVYDAADDICPDHAGQLRSDVLRYEILLEHGGVWVDADFECLRPIDPLVAAVDSFAAWELHPIWVNNAIMGARPGHPFFYHLVDGLRSNVEANLGSKPNVMTGPWYVTQTWRLGHSKEVKVFDEKTFYPFRWDEVDDFQPGEFDAAERWPLSYAVHWWRNKRRERGILPQ